MFTPSFDFEFNQIAATKQRIGNKVPVLQIFEYADSLVLKSGSEPFCQFTHTANPFAGINRITDPIHPFIWCAEVCIAAQNRKVVKPWAATGADIFVLASAFWWIADKSGIVGSPQFVLVLIDILTWFPPWKKNGTDSTMNLYRYFCDFNWIWEQFML